MTAKTGNVDLDRATAGLKIHEHGALARVVTAGVLSRAKSDQRTGHEGKDIPTLAAKKARLVMGHPAGSRARSGIPTSRKNGETWGTRPHILRAMIGDLWLLGQLGEVLDRTIEGGRCGIC